MTKLKKTKESETEQKENDQETIYSTTNMYYELLPFNLFVY